MRKVRRLTAGEEITLTEHLDELRNRLMIALLALAVAFAVAFWRHGDLLDLLNRQLPVQCVKQAGTAVEQCRHRLGPVANLVRGDAVGDGPRGHGLRQQR